MVKIKSNNTCAKLIWQTDKEVCVEQFGGLWRILRIEDVIF